MCVCMLLSIIMIQSLLTHGFDLNKGQRSVGNFFYSDSQKMKYTEIKDVAMFTSVM